MDNHGQKCSNWQMSGYVKLFGSILDSTVWQEDKATRLVWITMLATQDKEYVVSSSIPGLARRAGVEVEECREALRCLMSPDPDSRTKDYEGRRIAEVDGGWKVLNGEKYYRKLSKEERREYKTNKQAEYRERERLAGRSPEGFQDEDLSEPPEDAGEPEI